MSIETALQTPERIARLVDNLDTIATLPEVTARISATVNDPKSSAGELRRIISHDPSLVSRILKLVNSSFYGRSTKIDSVERAIVLLGFDAVHNLAISATMGSLFTHVNLCDDYTARDLWTHCVAVAAASREIAKMIDRGIAERAFLAGLVHDVGMLVELQVCPEKLVAVCQTCMTSRIPFSALELDHIGCEHSELGGALAAKWGFPEFCRSAASYHHHPHLAEPEHRQLTGIVYVADTLCAQDAIGFDLAAREQVAEAAGFSGLVPLDVIERARQNLPDLVSDAIMVFTV
jgi:HD-like signal output (HDOD) protein